MLQLFFTSIIGLLLMLPRNAPISVLLLVLYTLFISIQAGCRFLPAETTYVRVILGFLTALSLYSIIGTIAYYFHNLGGQTVLLMLVFTPWVLAFFRPHIATPQSENLIDAPLRNATIAPVSSFITFGLLISIFFLLTRTATTTSIRSPWELTPSHFFAIIAVMLCVFIFHLIVTRRSSPLLFIFFGIILIGTASILFPLGFGFDGFVHLATIDHIISHNEILPKMPYYIGAYVPMVLLGRTLGFTVLHHSYAFVSPILFALALFGAGTFFLRRSSLFGSVALIVLFAIPFTLFTTTTPYSISMALLLVCIFLLASRAVDSSVKITPIILLALATLCIHPIVGIPLALCTILVLIISSPRHKLLSHLVASLTLLVSVVALPAILTLFSGQSLIQTFSHWSLPPSPWPFIFPRPMDITLDIFYTIHALLPWGIIIATIFGSTLLAKKIGIRAFYFLLFPLALLVASGFMRSVSVPNVIAYEQDNFSIRLVELAILFSFPLLALTTARICQTLFTASRFHRIIGIVLIAITITSGYYFSYPRNTNVEQSRGFTVSADDFSAVKMIDEDANGETYIVLSNQALASVALATFRFNHYFSTDLGQQYFYPIPTGGPLYKYFLKMAYESPTSATAEEAMHFMHVPTLYFVMHDYWWNSAAIRETARKEATKSFMVGSHIEIFKFK